MRMIYWMGFVVATIPLMFGLASIKWGNTALVLDCGLIRLVYALKITDFCRRTGSAMDIEIAQHLIVMDEAKSILVAVIIQASGNTDISCSNCGKLLDNCPSRLSRKRIDGVFAGGLDFY